MECGIRVALPLLRRVIRGVAVAIACLSSSCSGGESFKSSTARRDAGNINVTASVNSIECPKITSYTVSPYKNAAGSDVVITSTTDASFGVRPVFRWTASSGTFDDIQRSDTTYNCGSETSPTITLTVTYGSCVDHISIVELDCT